MNKDDTGTLGLKEDETGLLNLIDKYIKANHNFLPLQAYLNYLELNNLNSLLPVSYSADPTVYSTRYGPINTNSSTLIAIPNEANETLQVAQKLYKFIISLDYSPQVTNLDFIQKGLETIFEKIKEEYDLFNESVNLEPQIYVTVLLWNSAYFQYRQNQMFNSFLNDDFIPFTTIFHAKRLLKSNLADMTCYIFEKVNEAKSVFLTMFKNSQKQLQRLQQQESVVMNDPKILKPTDPHNKSSLQQQNTKEIGSLERLLAHIIKIFSFFNVNNTATSTSAPTALSSAHHIYISDGLFYANDMIRCLEKISKSSITFSFICSGSSNQRHTANNISSSFGYVADHYLMKFIAQISSGFYTVIDENLDRHFILKKRLLLVTTLSKNNNKKCSDTSVDTLLVDNTNNTSHSDEEKTVSNNFCCSDNHHHHNENYFYHNRDTMRARTTSTTHRFSNLKASSKQILKEDQKFELKCIQKYELSSSVHSVVHLARFRTQEGFYLVQITRQQANSKSDLITLHFKRHFTQTTMLFYKLSYFLSTSCRTPVNASMQENETPTTSHDKFLIEIWLSWSFLHLKAKYQNLVLIQQLRHTLHHIQKLDFDRLFCSASLMLEPPDLLRLKEPLFKLALNQVDSNDLKAAAKLIVMQNSCFEINIRNKAMESEFTEFANLWLPLAFFKYNTNTLVKHFAVHTLKLILDHDRAPAPDIYTNIFTLKHHQQLHQQHQQPENHDLLAHHANYFDNPFSYPYNNSLNPYVNTQINQNNITNNSNNSNPNNNNNSNNSNNSTNIFQCRNSLNKLCVMLIDWCDLILVENCVFLKYLNASQLPTSEKILANEQRQQQEAQDDELNQLKNAPSQQEQSNESFVIVKLDTSCIPYVTLQYLFHSNVNYLDRMRLIQKFKEKLRVLNLKNLDADVASAQATSTGVTTPPPTVIITPPQQSSSLNKLLQTGLASPSSFKYTSSLGLNQSEVGMANLTSKLKKKQQECCCILLQKPELFDMILSHFNKMNNQHLQIDTTNKKGAQLQQQQQMWLQNPSHILNFMMQKKYKWSINKSFSVPISLTLKENIIDTFIRSRLREGFKCLFHSSKLAVFTIQLNMFDQGGLNHSETNRKANSSTCAPAAAPATSNTTTSSVNNEADASSVSSTSSSATLMATSLNKTKESQPTSNVNFKSGSSQFCTFVYVVYFMNNSSYYNQPRVQKNDCLMTNYDRKQTGSNDKIDQAEILSSLVSNYDESIYFTTEIYSEVIDGVFQDRKQNLTTENKRTSTDYFRNLTYMEIMNLIFLIDLKSFLTMQSVSTLFLTKTDSISNLQALLMNSVDSEANLTPALFKTNTSAFNFGIQQDTANKILTCHSNFYESIRILPDLNLVAKSLQQINQPASTASRLNSVSDAPTSNTGFVYKRIRPAVQHETDTKTPVSPSPSSTKSSLVDTTSSDTSKEITNMLAKKKKSDSVSLHEQLKPVLNSLFSCVASDTIPRDTINIDFQFSMRNILLESNLFMSVFEDIPFNLFTSKPNQVNSFETNSIYRIQKMFFSNIDENFKKADPNSTMNFASVPLVARSQHAARGSTASVEDLELNKNRALMDHVKKELKNTICLRLNEIKSGDVIVKQIVENLNSTTESELEGRGLNYYFRFSIASSTSLEVNYGQTKWLRNVSVEQDHMMNSENENRFFVFGLFFLNVSSNEQVPASNRLVFFMFDCMPDSIKKSLVNASSNTYLIRKSLFSAQKISNNRNQQQAETNKLAFSDTYRFYCNKSADLMRSQQQQQQQTGRSNKTSSSVDYLGHRNSTVPSLTTNTTPSSFMKKVFSISDILKLNLINLAGDTVFSSYIDFIEENCAKSYIESVIHYLGMYASSSSLQKHQQIQRLTNSEKISDDKRVKFEINSIKQLLKIGRKNPLVDVDLTDYLKQICSHLKETTNVTSLLSSKCASNMHNHSYLETKFNQLFLRKFNQIPGFNDLFIFTPNQYFTTSTSKKLHDGQISSIDHSFDNGILPGVRRKRHIMRKSNSSKKKQIRTDAECVQTFSQSFLGALKSTAQSSESIKQLIERELNESMNKSLDELISANFNTEDEDDDDEQDERLFKSDNDDDYYDYNMYSDAESDTNETSFIEAKSDVKANLLAVHSSTNTEEDATTDMDDDIMNLRKSTIRTRRKTSKFKSSSPFSNSSAILNKNFDPAKPPPPAKENPLASVPPLTGAKPERPVDEQIICIELVCVIGNDANDNTLMPGLVCTVDNLKSTNNGSATDLDEGARTTHRVRTTTLTPDYSNTNTNTDSLLTTTGLDNSGTASLDTQLKNNEPAQQVNETEIPPVTQFKIANRRSFISKFNKFNLKCLLDLIEEQDQNEFAQLVKQLESDAASEGFPTSESNASSSFSLANNVRVFLRFNWYSFSELNLNFASASQATNGAASAKLIAQQAQPISALFGKNLLQQRTAYPTSMIDNTNLLLQKSNTITSSVHSSSSTVYNSLSNVTTSQANANTKHLNRNYQQEFKYYHLLNPILNEFKWHLKDEIFQLEQVRIKHLLALIGHMGHVREGVRRKYTHCRMTRRKIVLNKFTTTTISTMVDPKPKTNASKLLSVNHLREQQQQQSSASSTKPAYKTIRHVEEDKTILSVDTEKFLVELISLLKNLTGQFYDCQLQQIHDYFFYLTCNLNNNNKGTIMLDENLNYSFKIIIHLHKNSTKKSLNNNQTINKNENKSPQTQQQHQQVPQQNITSQEITINQIKMKIYYSFNHTSFQNRDDLIDYLIIQFNQLLNKLIKSVYLSLTLKEIHDTKKWNNLLHLVDTEEESSSKQTQLKTNKSSASLATNTDPNDSVLTIKNNTVHGSLACNCVWSVKFKLHRLHQTIQKIHGSTEITPSTPSVLQQQQQQQQQQIASTSNLQSQQYISQGLKKLQEFLFNFKLEESSGDLYVYTRNDKIFLLKLEEIYEQHAAQPQNLNQTNNPPEVDNSVAYNDNSVELSASFAKQQQQQQQQSVKPGSLLSRRPSYASINDTDLTYKTSHNVTLTAGKSQNLSGGSMNNNPTANPNASQASNLNTTPQVQTQSLQQQQQQQQQQRSNPEYIKLSVYGLTEPDEEMKQDLCKTLQSELDYWLITKMCNSIEKNTFKTTSLQHPDKITDEDLTFFKSISENYFDFEIPLPFIFNFNKQMRENFFYFIKQIFNSQFKAIDAPPSHALHSNHYSSQFLSGSGQFRKSFSMRTKSSQQMNDSTTTSRANELEVENENIYDELALLCNQETTNTTMNTDQSVLSTSTSAVKTSTQTVSSMFHSQQLSFSFMSIQPQLGPYSTSKTSSLDSSSSKQHFGANNKRASDLDPYMILLSRILFHNSKNLRIGKHTVSLALVEALYAVKSLDVLVLSRVTRSNSIGANSVITPGAPTTTPKANQTSQILETSYTQSKLTGPTFVFRFYCRGENDTNAYKASLKSALNDALLYFFSEYITKIEPELYLKKMKLSKVPAQFRKFRFQIEQINSANTSASKCEKRVKKRHKSTGNCGEEVAAANEPNEELSLRMNKTAMNTNLGKNILKQQITTESQFNLFTLNNFNSNSFDHRNYEDTIEYFRESIRAFDYNRILNSFINDANNSASLLLSSSSASTSSIENENLNEDYASDSSESSEASDSESCESSKSELSNSLGDVSQTTMINNSQVAQIEPNTSTLTDTTPTLDKEKTSKLADKSKLNTIGFKKSHLRFIYEWLKGLYFVQARAGTNLCSRSVGSINLKSQSSSQSRSSHPTPVTPNLLGSSLIISPQQQQQQQQQQSQPTGSSPSALGGSLANIITNASGQQPFGPFILRKKFSYKTKYNLTSLIREIEVGLRESCKSNEITVNYYSFTSQKIKKTKSNKKAKSETPETTTTTTTNVTQMTVNETKELKSCLRNAAEQTCHQQSKQRADYYASCFNSLDDNEFENDFKNLKQTRFSNLHANLSRLENLIVTMNVEYCVGPSNLSANVFGPQQQQHHNQQLNNNNIAPGSSLSSSSSNNSSTNVLNTILTQTSQTSQAPAYSRVPSYSGNKVDQLNTAASNIMTKSINSNSGGDLFDWSLSNSLSMPALQLKRTYLYALCNARTKMITFYVFTTEMASHEQLRQLLDNSCELCQQRFHLVNNTVLYKYGGLIGDTMINDLKKVKHLTSLAVSASCGSSKTTTSSGSEASSSANDPNDANKPKQAPLNLPPHNSPKPIYRQFSYKLPGDAKYANPPPINTSLISNLTSQFGGTTTAQVSSAASSAQQQGAQSNLPFKQLAIVQTNYKPFDSIVNIINYQVNFCQQYLSTTSSISFNDPLSLVSTSLGLSHSSSYALLTSSNALIRQTSLINSSTINSSNLHLSQSIIAPNRVSFPNFSPTSTLYGVGLNYQLYELQQVYRHPKKIYELALTLVNHNTQAASLQQQQQQQSNLSASKPVPSVTSGQLVTKSSQQLTVNDFYKNYIVPVLIPFHFCCSPILFCPNWNELIVNEQSLRPHYFKNIENKTNLMQQSATSSNSAGSLAKTSKPAATQAPLFICNDTWYQKMRQIFLIEYTKYFEGRGFLRLKDELKETSNTKAISTENQTHHFIKWIQQDGFIYITVNLDEIFVNIKLGYCTRYRMASRSFLADLIKFFAQDFHVHSLTYDLHLLAINRNLTSPAWTSPKQMSLTISKFLDEFVEFFSRVPLFSSNKVFKNIYERTDHSLLPHKFGLIFDYMIFAKKKLNKNGQFNSCSFTPLDLNLDNNIGIYTLGDQKPDSYSKYLVIKIESFTTSTPLVAQSMLTSQSSRKPVSKTESLHSTKLTASSSKQTLPTTPQQQPQPPRLASSSSSSSLINQRALSSENSFSNLTQTQQILRQNSIQQPSSSSTQQQSLARAPSTLAKSNQSTKHEAHIRLVCYYLCINKQSTSFVDHRNPVANLFDQDLLFIDKIVEEAVNVYKLETFWDNLMMSMSSITDYLNESSAGYSAHPTSAPITFSIESDELEQILNHSQKIDALDLDPSLFSFLQECYSIKDKIHTSFEFSFGRHFIFTQSDSVEYCLLLINENLIKKFRCSVSSSIQHQANQAPISLASFVLSDRVLHSSSASSPSSLSSSHSSSTKVSSSAATSASSASSSAVDANTDKQLNSFILLKFDKMYKMTYLWQINRIVQQELNESILSNAPTGLNATTTQASFSANKNNKISSNKYLSFTINNLIYVLWEDLFTN